MTFPDLSILYKIIVEEILNLLVDGYYINPVASIRKIKQKLDDITRKYVLSKYFIIM